MSKSNIKKSKPGAPRLAGPRPESINGQPCFAVMTCNDTTGRAELGLLDLGGSRLCLSITRKGKHVFRFALAKWEARQLAMWLVSRL